MKPSEVINALIRPRVPGTVTTVLADVVIGGADHYLWAGPVPGASGRLWIPTLYGAQQVRRAVLRLMRERKMEQDEAMKAMDEYHTGLGDPDTSLACLAYVEIDHLSQVEQEARYAALAEATGIEWALKVFSGGKSVHAYIAFRVPLVADDPIREEIQRLLVVTLEGDTRIVNRGRLMRLPGWFGRDRQQPVLHLDPVSAYDAVDLRDRLAAHAASMGITDVKVAYDTLFEAELLTQRARKEPELEVAEALLEHAELLRSTRGSPDPRDLRVARAMRGTGSKSSSGAGADSAKPVGAPRERLGRALWHDLPVPNPYVGVAPRTAVDAPCCLAKGGRKGTVYDHDVVWCHRHDWGFRPGGDRVPDTDVHDFDIGDLFDDDGQVVDLEREGAERAVERREADLRDQDMAPLHEKARAKRAAADALAPEVVLGARAALVVADEIIGDARHVLGICDGYVAPCGFYILSQSAASGQISTFRAGCGRLGCRSCGPTVVASKIGAVLHMPVTNDGVVTGDSMCNRTVFVYEVRVAEFDTFKRTWRRFCPTSSKNIPSPRESGTETRTRCGLCRKTGHNRQRCPTATEATNVENMCGDHAYAAFHCGSKVVVLSTFEVAGPNLIVALKDAERVKRVVVWLGLSTYKVENDPIRVVMGKISSSQNLHLDPAGIARKAAGSSWVALATHVRPGEVADALKARAVGVQVKGDNIRTVGSVSLETAVNIAEAAGGRIRIEPAVVIEQVQSVFFDEVG